MPATVQSSSIETPPPGMIGEEVVDHPLSPLQEQGVEAIVRSITCTMHIGYMCSLISIVCSTQVSRRAAKVCHLRS